jgi:hypothetical protein
MFSGSHRLANATQFSYYQLEKFVCPLIMKFIVSPSEFSLKRKTFEKSVVNSMIRGTMLEK